MSQKYIFIKFFRIVKHVFNNVLIVDLEYVWCLITEKGSAESPVICLKVAKCKPSSILTSIQNTYLL
jgi:hypothetical protein